MPSGNNGKQDSFRSSIKTQSDAAFYAGYKYGAYEIADQAGSIDALQNFREILPIVARGFICTAVKFYP